MGGGSVIGLALLEGGRYGGGGVRTLTALMLHASQLPHFLTPSLLYSLTPLLTLSLSLSPFQLLPSSLCDTAAQPAYFSVVAPLHPNPRCMASTHPFSVSSGRLPTVE